MVLFVDVDGVVVEILVELGQVVGVGQVVVCVVYVGCCEVIIEFFEILCLVIGFKVQVVLYGSVFMGVVKLCQLLDVVNLQMWIFEVCYVLEGLLVDVLLGLIIVIYFVFDCVILVLQVLFGVIFDLGKGFGVWLVEKDMFWVIWCVVQVVGFSSESVVVVSGFVVGDCVVVFGVYLLYEGDFV